MRHETFPYKRSVNRTAAQKRYHAWVEQQPCLSCEQSVNPLEIGRPGGCANTTPDLTITSDRTARMAAKPLPSQDALRQLLRYEPETGFLYWKRNTIAPRTPARHPGSRALSYVTKRGYCRGGLLGRAVMAHRVVWKWHYGTEPAEIDHIDGDKTNNRIENLRAATRQDNVRNTCIRKTNRSGVQGVYWHRGKRAWIASIRTDGRKIDLGAFSSLDDAAECRKQAERKFGYHPNHGRPAR